MMLGHHELGRELGRRGAEVSYAGVDTRRNAPVCVRVLHTGDLASGARADFLRSAALQRNLAAAGARGVQPVLDLGEHTEVAYAVEPPYETTLDRLPPPADARAAGAMSGLLTSLLGALRDIREIAERDHGDLSVLSVRVIGRNGSGWLLAEPSPRPDSARSDTVGLAELIYQLVTGRSFDPVTSWPIADGVPWSKLGAVGAKWAALCREVLDPARPPAQDLAMLEGRL